MIQHLKGRAPRQAHVDVPKDLYEDEMGRRGFTGRWVSFYRKNPPNEYTRVEGGLVPGLLMSYELTPSDLNDPNSLPLRIAYSEDIRYSISRRCAAMPFYFRKC